VDLPEGGKAFKYSKQLREIANREQVSLCIDLNDLANMDQELADACIENAKRYNELFYEAIHELLPEYKDKDVII
jgi:DNA replication licensing factor MCM7